MIRGRTTPGLVQRNTFVRLEMAFMGHVQSSQDICMKYHRESALFQRATSRISKNVHEFIGFIGHYQLLIQHIFVFYSARSSNSLSEY